LKTRIGATNGLGSPAQADRQQFQAKPSHTTLNIAWDGHEGYRVARNWHSSAFIREMSVHRMRLDWSISALRPTATIAPRRRRVHLVPQAAMASFSKVCRWQRWFSSNASLYPRVQHHDRSGSNGLDYNPRLSCDPPKMMLTALQNARPASSFVRGRWFDYA